METWGLSASDSHLLPRTSPEAALKQEGLQKFLQDTVPDLVLEDEGVLGHTRTSMIQLRRMQCNLVPLR